MSHQLSSTERHMSPAKVWVRLTVDCRAQAIRLMAQLAFKLVAAQSDLLVKEATHAIPPRHAQSAT